MKKRRIFASGALSALTVFHLVGCTQVAPWERGTLARQEMAVEPDALRAAVMKHTYTSKEAASGGYGVGGGGCGCN